MSTNHFLTKFRKNTHSFYPYLLTLQFLIPLSKLGFSFFTLSFSLFVNAICGILIVFGKFLLFSKRKQSTIYPEQLSTLYKLLGMIITIVSLFFVLYSTSFFSLDHQPKTFTLTTGIAIALLTLIELIISISGIIASRKTNNRLAEYLKMINLVSAVISISLTQSALLSLNHNEASLIFFNLLSSLFWGMIICMIGIKMILLSNRPS